MSKLNELPVDVQEKLQEWAINEALSTVFSDYEGGGYEVINTLEPWQPFEYEPEDRLLELTEDFERQFTQAALFGYDLAIRGLNDR